MLRKHSREAQAIEQPIRQPPCGHSHDVEPTESRHGNESDGAVNLPSELAAGRPVNALLARRPMPTTNPNSRS